MGNHEPASRRHALQQAALTALVYASTGLAALLLAGPPGHASPLFPPAGIALAAAIAWGRPALVGTWLGSAIVNATLGWLNARAGLVVAEGWAAWALPALIGLGAAAQAALGAWLIRRHVSQPLLLNEPSDIARGGFAAAVACLVSPTVATLALVATGALALEAAPGNWLTWWAGDTLGAFIAAPLVLASIAHPAPAWRPRRRSLGVPLVAVLALLAGAMWAVAAREREHSRRAFERESDRLAASVQQAPADASARVAGADCGGQRQRPARHADYSCRGIVVVGSWFAAAGHGLQRACGPRRPLRIRIGSAGRRPRRIHRTPSRPRPRLGYRRRSRGTPAHRAARRQCRGTGGECTVDSGGTRGHRVHAAQRRDGRHCGLSPHAVGARGDRHGALPGAAGRRRGRF